MFGFEVNFLQFLYKNESKYWWTINELECLVFQVLRTRHCCRNSIRSTRRTTTTKYRRSGRRPSSSVTTPAKSSTSRRNSATRISIWWRPTSSPSWSRVSWLSSENWSAPTPSLPTDGPFFAPSSALTSPLSTPGNVIEVSHAIDISSYSSLGLFSVQIFSFFLVQVKKLVKMLVSKSIFWKITKSYQKL